MCKKYAKMASFGFYGLNYWEMDEHIDMLSSPHDSPFTLVLCVSRSSRNSDGIIPLRGR